MGNQQHHIVRPGLLPDIQVLTDDCEYTYWPGYICRCECHTHNEPSRMVYGILMRASYAASMRSWSLMRMLTCEYDELSDLNQEFSEIAAQLNSIVDDLSLQHNENQTTDL